ncbi:IS3 family transposase [Actinocorallia herbida]|uniref:IS3 family transposase n=1 Tax=Actinocorallia herbida TaxID=58109 RepID=UPI000F4CA6E0|nr:IS3 family transposase [Actinocorallia herbida]
MARSKRNYSPEYRQEAARLVVDSSRPIAQVAKELGINAGTLANWVSAYRRENAGEEAPLTLDERVRLKEQEREIQELKMELEFGKKSGVVLRSGAAVTSKYEFIDAEYANPSVVIGDRSPAIVQMCAWLGVSRSGFYEWRSRPESATARRRDELKAWVRHFFDVSDGTYGYRRIHTDLVEQGVPAGPELVRSVMRELGLEPCQPRPWRVGLTEQDGQAHHVPDLVQRDFTASAPGEKLVGDITYVETWEGWIYLATVIDCYSRAVIGWAIGEDYKTPLIEKAIGMAARNHRLAESAIFHSDRGSNYMSRQFAETLRRLRLRQSTGRTGVCWDNALAESFFAALKNERVHRTEYPTREHARRDIIKYIELWYNPRRRHSALGNKSPAQVHTEPFPSRVR